MPLHDYRQLIVVIIMDSITSVTWCFDVFVILP